MNFIKSSIDQDPKRLDQFLQWMSDHGVSKIDEITGDLVQGYFDALKETRSKRTGDYISLATQRTYLTMVKRFARYMRLSEQININVPVQFKGKEKSNITVLSKAEIERLYRFTDDSLLGIRDRAMLAIYYGCGLRRNEGVHLEIRDILPDKNLLYIRKGKGYKERYVPMVGKVKKHILDYVQVARPMLLGNRLHEVLMVQITGKPIAGSGMYERFKLLVKAAGIEKKVGLHTLRHSIATHLLTNGMKLSDIARFLGHASLESTQIYTHLKDEL